MKLKDCIQCIPATPETKKLIDMDSKRYYQNIIATMLETAEKDDREHGTHTKSKLYDALNKYFQTGCDFYRYRRKIEKTERLDTTEAVYKTILWLEGEVYEKRLKDMERDEHLLKDRERDEHLNTIVREARKMKSVLLRIEADASKMEHDFRCLHEFIASMAKETDYRILDAYLLNITQYAERYNLGSRTDRDYLRMTRTAVQEVLQKERGDK